MNTITVIIIAMTIINVSLNFYSYRLDKETKRLDKETKRLNKKLKKQNEINAKLDIELALVTYANDLYDEMKQNMEVVKNAEHADYFKLGYRSAVIDLHLILEQDAKKRGDQRNEYLHRDL